MNQFKVLYYPNSDCHPLVLAKSILVFDEIIFYDHPSLTFKSIGTIGHDSAMRQIVPALKKEGYEINVIKPKGGPVEGELKKIIDADLANKSFCKTFFQLIKNDPSFLMSKVHDGNYGKYGDANHYRQKILEITEKDIPKSIDQISSFKPVGGIPPEVLTAMTIASDSYNLNFSSYVAIQNGANLFGDSKAMDMLLKAKYGESVLNSRTQLNIPHRIAFTLLQYLIPNEKFKGKRFVDIIRFRNTMYKDREKFKEHILEMTSDLENDEKHDEKQKIDEIIYKYLLPEAKEYQYRLAENWDNFFKESTKTVINSSDEITKIVATILPFSLQSALLSGALFIGKKVLPHLIDYLKEKEALERINPFTYLMKFK